MRVVRSGRLGELLSTYVDRSFTYPEVGATATRPPDGYRLLQRRAIIGSGDAAFERAAHALMAWRMHEAAGLAVAAGGSTASTGQTALLGLGRPLSLVIPCRVAYLVEEPQRRVLATGTVSGHPLTGEEAFTVTIDDGGAVSVQILSFSRPANPLVSAGGPFVRLGQSMAATRYIRALARAAAT